MDPAEPPLTPGDTAEVVMLSMCVGGLLRTWTGSGQSQLWSVRDADLLSGLQGRGLIARTVREERRFREVGMLVQETGTLMLQSRFPQRDTGDRVEVAGHVVRLEPATGVVGSVAVDVQALLTRAVVHCLGSSDFLVVELGGWDSPREPFCLFVVLQEDTGPMTVFETAPEPHGSALWAPSIVPGRPTQTLSAPATEATFKVAPALIAEAIATWSREPWDLALTFGQR